MDDPRADNFPLPQSTLLKQPQLTRFFTIRYAVRSSSGSPYRATTSSVYPLRLRFPDSKSTALARPSESPAFPCARMRF